MLDEWEIIGCLCRHGLSHPEAAATRHRRTVRVDNLDGSGCLVKEPAQPDVESLMRLRRESLFYKWCHKEAPLSRVARLIPKFLAYEEAPPLLVLELLGDAITLWNALASSRHKDTTDIAFSFGTALAVVHHALRHQGEAPAWLHGGTPWAFRLHRPEPADRASLSQADAQLLRLVQGDPALSASLGRLRECWRPHTLIHNDLKLANVLMLPPKAGGASGRMRLIDWEFAQWGDPAWDVAGGFHDFVHCWIVSMLRGGPLDADRVAAGADFPLAKVHWAAGAFWRGYKSAAVPPEAEADLLLSRAVAFSGARAIQTAYEWCNGARRLSRQAVLLLQVGANVLADPVLARRHLYGLD